jgi:glyoxylase-like metal-dependent hydrolase (beta-lactamase superfamily II)
MESTTYLLLDENGAEHAIFSGDTLFIGDVEDLISSKAAI